MLRYMLDTIICIYVMKNYPARLRERFNRLAEQLCISSITLGELHYGAEKSARRLENLEAIAHFAARLEVLSFSPQAAAHYGQIRAELERAGRPAGAHDMLIGGHAAAKGWSWSPTMLAGSSASALCRWRTGPDAAAQTTVR